MVLDTRPVIAKGELVELVPPPPGLLMILYVKGSVPIGASHVNTAVVGPDVVAMRFIGALGIVIIIFD